MADRTLAQLLADAERDPPRIEDDERGLWADVLSGTTGAINRLQRKLKGKKKPADDDRPVAMGIRG